AGPPDVQEAGARDAEQAGGDGPAEGHPVTHDEVGPPAPGEVHQVRRARAAADRKSTSSPTTTPVSPRRLTASWSAGWLATRTSCPPALSAHPSGTRW